MLVLPICDLSRTAVTHIFAPPFFFFAASLLIASILSFSSYDNYIYIFDTDGNVDETVVLNKTNENSSGNITLDYKGGDERCMLVTTARADVAGMELSQEEKDKIEAINNEDGQQNRSYQRFKRMQNTRGCNGGHPQM